MKHKVLNMYVVCMSTLSIVCTQHAVQTRMYSEELRIPSLQATPQDRMISFLYKRYHESVQSGARTPAYIAIQRREPLVFKAYTGGCISLLLAGILSRSLEAPQPIIDIITAVWKTFPVLGMSGVTFLAANMCGVIEERARVNLFLNEMLESLLTYAAGHAGTEAREMSGEEQSLCQVIELYAHNPSNDYAYACVRYMRDIFPGIRFSKRIRI